MGKETNNSGAERRRGTRGQETINHVTEERET